MKDKNGYNWFKQKTGKWHAMRPPTPIRAKSVCGRRMPNLWMYMTWPDETADTDRCKHCINITRHTPTNATTS